jgi:predicted TIM-barrel fold metal-dependent hydrolase
MHKYGLTEKVLFASDYPHPDFKTTLKALKEVKLPLDFEKKILFENAVKLLRLS